MHVKGFDVVNEFPIEGFAPSGLLWNPTKHFSGSVSLNKGLVVVEN